MTSTKARPSAPERPGLGDLSEGEVYRYGSFHRSSAFAPLVAAGLLSVVALWMASAAIFSEDTVAPSEWLSVAAFLLIGLTGAYQSAGKLLSSFHLGEGTLQQRRPLHSDREVPLSEVRRMFIGGQSVEIYASSGDEPDIEFGRHLSGGDDLIEKIARRLPSDAEIQCPSGELQARLNRPA